MIDKATFDADMTALLDKMRGKLGLRSGPLRRRLRRAGRLLPKPAHHAGRVLVAAEARMAHPKLRARVDAARVGAAFSELHRHLDAIDPADRRRGALLGLAGGIVFNLLLVGAALLVFLSWRGLL